MYVGMRIVYLLQFARPIVVFVYLINKKLLTCLHSKRICYLY